MKSFAITAVCFLFSNAWGAEPTVQTNVPVVPRPTLSDVLQAAGVPTIPAAWAGIWDFSNSDYDCTTKAFLGSDADTDTLCTGGSLSGGQKMNCTGTVDDTTVDVSCTGQFEIFEGCIATFTYTLSATRNGDNLTSVSTFATDYTPDLCAFSPDDCVETQSTATRVGPEPPDCVTSVDEFSWGRVKALYR